MDRLHIALCENEREEQERLLGLLSCCAVPADISAFESGEAFLEKYRPALFDLILMDIYLDGISGIEAVRRIREKGEKAPVAFITASRDHALDAYRLNVEKYLEKPVSQKSVSEALQMALEKRASRPGITVFSAGKPLFMPADTLICIKQKAHYLYYCLTGKRTLQAKGRLDELQPQLAGLPFFRYHKSFLVNLAFVTGIDRELMTFHMQEGIQAYIRREGFKAAREAWENWLFSAAREER